MSKPVALITGGASGIGLALAKHLLSRNWKVVMADMNSDAGNERAAELGADSLFVQVDVTEYAEQAAAFKRAFSWGGDRLDLFVGNAAIPDTQDFYSDGEVDESGDLKPLNLTSLNINLDAVLQGMWLYKHYARKNKKPGGKIFLAGSMASFYSATVNPQYCAAKHAIIGIVRGTGKVLPKTDNITVNCICPGFIATPLCPPAVLEIFPKDRMSPMKTALDAYDRFLEDDTMSGETVELSNEELYFAKQQDYSSETLKWLGTEAPAVWEQAFRNMAAQKA